MIINFGMAFDEGSESIFSENTFRIEYYGPQKLINYLSIVMGLPKPLSGVEYLRLEQYRQAIKVHLQAATASPFYAASFQSDQFAVANDLLKMRDELWLSGWNFEPDSPLSLPSRIQTILEIEHHFKSNVWSLSRFWCFEERLDYIIKNLPHFDTSIEKIFILEPLALYPPYVKRLFDQFSKVGISVEFEDLHASSKSGSDLFQFNQTLQGKIQQSEWKSDGSLMLLKGRNEAQLAEFLAKLLKLNPNFFPRFLIGNGCQALEHAFIQEGLPTFGIETSSMAKPSLQILKLVTLFLWKPVNPYHLLEFVSLPVKPLADDLANRIADHVAQYPGTKGERWFAMIGQYFNEMEEAEIEPSQLKEIRFQYRFWFDRNRYTASQMAPKSEVVEIFEFLGNWAMECYHDGDDTDNGLLNLSIQASNIKDLLEITPEQRLRRLEIERIVKTVYSPSKTQLLDRQLGAFSHYTSSNSLNKPVDHLVWWNFVSDEPSYFFSKWYNNELQCFKELHLEVDSPDRENQFLNWKRKQPFLKTQSQLILCIPEKWKGQPVQPHPYLGNIEAAFHHIDMYDIDDPKSIDQLNRFFVQPSSTQARLRTNQAAKPFIELDEPIDLNADGRIETPTSLETLLYYPYKWFFRYFCKLRSIGIQSIVDQPTLFGNLAHRILEQLLVETYSSWSKEQMEAWIEQRAQQLFQQEGSTLLLYGNEAERTNFVNRVKFASWTLISMLKKNNWKVVNTEQTLTGELEDISLKARTDLLLERANQYAIIDLKWRGISFRKQLLKNEEDLQLVLYADLVNKNYSSLPNTAYYIINRSTLLARSQDAFKEANVVKSGDDEKEVQQRIFERMVKTYHWRKDQLDKGRIEIRHRDTLNLLEDIYQDDPILEILEMKSSDAPFDDYRILIKPFE